MVNIIRSSHNNEITFKHLQQWPMAFLVGDPFRDNGKVLLIQGIVQRGTLTSQSCANHIFHARSPVQKSPCLKNVCGIKEECLCGSEKTRGLEMFLMFFGTGYLVVLWFTMECGICAGVYWAKAPISVSKLTLACLFFVLCPPSKFKRNTVQQISASTGHIHK